MPGSAAGTARRILPYLRPSTLRVQVGWNRWLGVWLPMVAGGGDLKHEGREAQGRSQPVQSTPFCEQLSGCWVTWLESRIMSFLFVGKISSRVTGTTEKSRPAEKAQRAEEPRSQAVSAPREPTTADGALRGRPRRWA